ncbi:MAG: ComEC/Rec2 family competence protein [Lachnospiraceae bacterium]|nr:ComEC/Rec2 family competence protein [Lachnospiraceae bacterium]
MKRPLFWVCVLLSVIVVLHFYASGAHHREGIREASPPDDQLVFSGKVCAKELRGGQVVILLTDLSSNQNAAASRQIISTFHKMHTDRLQCVLAPEAGFAMPKIGSRVVVSGKFEPFREATNPGEFNLAEYYQGRQVGGALKDALVLEESERYSVVGEALYGLRAYFAARLEKIFPARDAGTLRAMLLGERSALEEEVRSLYVDGGIMHVLCISGLHVSLLGMGLYELLRRLGVGGKLSAVLAGTVLFLYGIMTGMSVSACRAIGMFLLRMFASVVGRTYDLLTALAVMACVLLIHAPSICLNSGFWLSFGSMVGVGAILPLWENLRKDDMASPILTRGMCRAVRILLSLAEKVSQGVRASLSVLLVTSPLLLWFYYEMPVYSTLLNLLVIPAMGPVLLFGFLAMLVPGLGILGTVDVAAFALFEKLCEAVGKLPFHTWNPGCPKLWQVMAYYVALALILWVLWHTKRGRYGGAMQAGAVRAGAVSGGIIRVDAPGFVKRLCAGILRKGMLLAALPLLLFAIPTRQMTGAAFLDVGQGDCVCIRLADGQTYLYDCGSVTKGKVGEKILLPYLKHEGIHRIHGIFLSHADTDHVSGVLELLLLAKQEDIRIDAIYVSAQGDFSRVEETANTALGLQVKRLARGDVLEGTGIQFVALHPVSVASAQGNSGASLNSQSTSGKVTSAQSSPGGKAAGMQGNSGTAAGMSLDENEASLCLWVKLEKGKNSMTILLTGDVQGEGEKGLISAMRERNIHKVDILKCAHHGSANATSEAFLECLDARYVVISCARKNSYGHPHASLLERLTSDGATILRTDTHGAIILRSK